jgi:hypothetical protein
MRSRVSAARGASEISAEWTNALGVSGGTIVIVFKIEGSYSLPQVGSST